MKLGLHLVLCGALLCLCGGCSRLPAVSGPTLGVKVAVMDFQSASAPGAEAQRVEGWWLGARDVREQPNLGRIAADRFNQQLGRVPNVQTISRIQVKYYFADKQAYLEQAAGELSPEQALDYLYQAPAEKFGRQLGVDYIVRGEIFEARLARNRTLDYFWSTVDLSLDLIECGNGTVVWTGNRRISRAFNSPVAVAEQALDTLLRQMDREYFSLR